MASAQTPADLDVGDVQTIRRRLRVDRDHPHYKWVALSNTTLGMLMVTINSSIVIISLPAIFRGIHLNPLEPANVSYLLWLLMGFLLTSAVLVVMFGRLGDMYGRVKIYNAGFVVFTVSAIALSFDPFDVGGGAIWLIAWRVIQGVGGAMLMANSAAILTDAFPAKQRGVALGINSVAAVAGSFIGLLVGGLLAEWDWKAVFWVSVPFGIIGTIWSYRSLHDNGQRTPGSIDIPGTVAFAVGLTALLTGINYGIQPYGNSKTGWTNPWVLSAVIGGIVVLIAFCFIEIYSKQPMFNMKLFRNKTFALGNFASLMASVSRGGMQFMLIIWLQGIWLPLHGFNFEDTPLWAGIYMLPLTIGFLVAGPVSGWLSDRYGGRVFAAGGLLLAAITFVLLVILPVDFNYWVFAVVILLNGLGTGIFTSPNTAEIMSAVPASQRGVASGMRGTLMNGGMALSIGVFFSLMIAGLSNTLPGAMNSGLLAQGVPGEAASQLANMPPVGSLFATFLGYNPFKELLGPKILNAPGVNGDTITGQSFFPHLISGPFHTGLVAVFIAAAVMMLLGSIASWFAKSDYVADEAAELAEATREGMGDDIDRTLVAATANTGTANAAAATTRLPAPTVRPLAAEGRTVSGRITHADGSAVPGAALTLIDQRGHQVSRAGGSITGDFVLEPPAPGSYVLIVSAGGHQPAAVNLVVAGHPQRLDIPLQGSGELSGIVHTVDTRPVADATITLTDMRGEVVGAAVSGADGGYSCQGVVSGVYTLVAVAEHMRPSAITLTVPDSGQLRHDIELAPMAVLTGTIRGAGGRAVADAQVVVHDASGAVLGSARTDEDGRYRVSGLSEGNYTVVASGYPPVTSRVVVAGGQIGHDLRLGYEGAHEPNGNGYNGNGVHSAAVGNGLHGHGSHGNQVNGNGHNGNGLTARHAADTE
ncbi:MFS transporter [Nocardia sp. NEAU-G5]|uniref:MFS transporter n=1 Tax=Nocardia albiluteola TaxID=2842303 RepID=A0ABS6B3E8_9NOCA|nr:MFS transporter [Nocardia albiluteola]